MVSGSQVQLGEVYRTVQLIEQICYQWNRVVIPHCHFVQCAIVDAQSEAAVVLLLEQDRGAVG